MATSYWADGDVIFNDEVAVWQPGRMFPTLTDGIKIGDSPQEYCVVSLSDGLKAGDSRVCIARMRPIVSDGMKMSDSLDAKQTLFPDLSEGLVLSDSPDVNCTFYCELADGFEMSDADQEYFVEQLTDGIKISDFTLYKKEKSELRIDYVASPITLEFDCNMVFDDNFKAIPLDKSMSTIATFLETFHIDPITMSFKGQSINFNFKANPKDYDRDDS